MPRRGIVRRYKCDGCKTLGDGTGGRLPPDWNRWMETGLIGRCYCGECVRKLSDWREQVLADAIIGTRPQDVLPDAPSSEVAVRMLDRETFTCEGYPDEREGL